MDAAGHLKSQELEKLLALGEAGEATQVAGAGYWGNCRRWTWVLEKPDKQAHQNQKGILFPAMANILY